MAKFLKNYLEQAKSVLTQPKQFFAKMAVTGGYRGPAVFIIITTIIGSLLSLFVSGIFSPLILAGMVVLSPLAIVGVMIAAAIIHILLKILGAKRNYEATFRVFSYAYAVSLFSWIPLVGVFASLYGIYLEVIGLSKVHSISKLRVLVALLLPIVIIAAIIAALVGSAALIGMQGGAVPGTGGGMMGTP